MLSILIVVLLERGSYVWPGYGFIIAMAVLGLIGTLGTLLLYVFRVQKTRPQLPWKMIELCLCAGLALAFFVCTGLGLFDCVRIFAKDWAHHKFAPPALIGAREWRNRVAAATAFSGINSVLFSLSAVYAYRGFFAV